MTKFFMAKMLIISILFAFCNMALPKYILLPYCFSLAWNLSIKKRHPDWDGAYACEITR